MSEHQSGADDALAARLMAILSAAFNILLQAKSSHAKRSQRAYQCQFLEQKHPHRICT